MGIGEPGGYALVSGAALEANDSTKKMPLGTIRQDREGNLYRYIKAKEALTRGAVVTQIVKAAWDSTIVMDGASADGDTVLHVDTNTSVITKNEFEGYWISQATATGLGKAYQIKSHPAIGASSEMDVELVEACEEIIADGGVLLIYNPFEVELVDDDEELIIGVAIGVITIEYFGWIQISGHVPAVQVGHSTSDAIVLDEPLVPVEGVPGACQGMAGDDEAANMLSTSSPLLSLQSVNANTTGFVEALMRRMF